MKNAFISHCKELGCDENYIKVCENKFRNIETSLNDYSVYKQDYERVMKEKNSLLKEYAKSQKEHKALEIIKVEMPNLTLLASCKGYERYKQKSGDNLTRKEYELLREVLL